MTEYPFDGRSTGSGHKPANGASLVFDAGEWVCLVCLIL